MRPRGNAAFMAPNRPSLDTLLAQAQHYSHPEHGAVVPGIETATTYVRDETYAPKGRQVYARDGSPTTDVAEAILAEADGAARSMLFTSGQSAIVALFETLRTGDHVVAPDVMYHGGAKWLRRLAELRGIEATFFDTEEPGALAKALQPNTKMVWVETPTNPTWSIIDIAAAADLAHAQGALLVVDATVTPPVTTRPLDLGADVMFASATKYLNGHSDVLAGLVSIRSNTALIDELTLVRTLQGTALPAFESWLLIRGMRTLSLRYKAASEAALRIAQHFEGHPAVSHVLYPGLPSNPGHEIAAQQMTGGFGGMLSLRVHGGFDAARKVATSTRVFLPATSLGGVESLIEHRIAVEPPESRVPDDLLRLSIGIESVEDLIADLEQALA